MKDLNVNSPEDLKQKVSDVDVFGDPWTWRLICKASSKEQGWMKSTKAMQVSEKGVVLQVTTQQGDNVAEALVYVPGGSIHENDDGSLKIV